MISGDELVRDFEELWAEIDRDTTSSSAHDRFDRDEIYEERLGRYNAARRLIDTDATAAKLDVQSTPRRAPVR